MEKLYRLRIGNEYAKINYYHYMTTKELIAQIAKETGMTKRRTEELLTATTEVIAESLQDGKAVQLQNFGTLETKQRAARKITNPKTGEVSMSQAKRVIGFRPNERLKDILR